MDGKIKKVKGIDMDVSDHKKQKKVKKWIIVIIAFIIAFSGIAYIGFKVILYPIDKIYIMAYDTTNDKIKGNVAIEKFLEHGEVYDIGANMRGYAVFKNPDKAYKQLVKDYSEVIEEIKEMYGLPEFSKTEVDVYCNYANTYSHQAQNQKVQDKAKFISAFCDIFENSINERYFFN